ncbi:MAG: hypothetical protein V6Z82_04640 [Flavobacteriales bacterium]
MKTLRLFLTIGLACAWLYACTSEGGRMATSVEGSPYGKAHSIQLTKNPSDKELCNGIAQFFERVAQIKTKGEEVIFFSIFWDSENQQLSMGNLTVTDDFFPLFLDDAEIENAIAQGNGQYTVSCAHHKKAKEPDGASEQGGADQEKASQAIESGYKDWEESCSGKWSCGSLVVRCLKEKGCATVCETEVLYLPLAYLKGYLAAAKEANT